MAVQPLNSGRRYRAAVIGCGRMGRGSIEDEILDLPGRTLLPYSHAGAISDVPSLELIAGADPSEGALADFTKRWGVTHTYHSYSDMLAAEHPEVVCVATSTPAHYEAVIACARAGVRGIYCEKPIATTLEEADQMIGACENGGTTLIVNHMRRWEPYYVRARQLLDNGRIGRVISIVGHIGEPFSFGGTHLVDIFRFYGGEVKEVFGHVDQLAFSGSSQDVFLDAKTGVGAYLTFENGARGLITQDYGFEADIIGTKGRLKMSDSQCELWDGTEKDLMWGTLKNAGFPASLRHTSPMVTALQELIRCMQNENETSISDGRQARHTMEVLVGVFESARRNAPVSLPIQNRRLGVATA